MALSLETLQEQRDALQLAILTGQKSVGYRDKTVTYRDLDEMRGILSDLDNQIAKLQGATRSRQIRMVTRHGYDPGTT